MAVTGETARDQGETPNVARRLVNTLRAAVRENPLRRDAADEIEMLRLQLLELERNLGLIEGDEDGDDDADAEGGAAMRALADLDPELKAQIAEAIALARGHLDELGEGRIGDAHELLAEAMAGIDLEQLTPLQRAALERELMVLRHTAELNDEWLLGALKSSSRRAAIRGGVFDRDANGIDDGLEYERRVRMAIEEEQRLREAERLAALAQRAELEPELELEEELDHDLISFEEFPQWREILELMEVLGYYQPGLVDQLPASPAEWIGLPPGTSPQVVLNRLRDEFSRHYLEAGERYDPSMPGRILRAHHDGLSDDDGPDNDIDEPRLEVESRRPDPDKPTLGQQLTQALLEVSESQARDALTRLVGASAAVAGANGLFVRGEDDVAPLDELVRQRGMDPRAVSMYRVVLPPVPEPVPAPMPRHTAMTMSNRGRPKAHTRATPWDVARHMDRHPSRQRAHAAMR